mgnify:CR=1 FL=1
MAVNSIFHTSNVAALATEQNLYRDLVVESIQIELLSMKIQFLEQTILQNLLHKQKLKCIWKIVRVVLLVRKN